jgi:hypothetical protein
MRYAVVRLTRSEAQERVSEFRPWEVDILSMIHGPESVEVVGEKDDGKPYPDAESEYERLVAKYKSPEGSNTSYAQMVYGVGAAKLAKVLRDAERDAKSRPPEEFVPVVKRDLKAEREERAADLAAISAERKANEDAAQALADKEAAIAAKEQELADREAALEREKAEVAAALDAATQTPAKPAKTKATPIAE